MSKNMRFIWVIGIALLFASCSAIKTIKLINKGSVVQTKFSTEIPFETSVSGHIIIKVKIKGAYRKFIFDTGAPNAISKDLAEEINAISLVETKAVDSQKKKQGLKLVALDSVFINEACFINTAALVVDFNQSNEIKCFGADGLIGNNLMKNAVWQIDFEKKVIKLTNEVTSGDLQNAVSVPFTTDATCAPKMNLSIGGIADKGVIIDFGSNGYYHTTASVFKKLKKQNSISKYAYAFGSIASGMFGAQTDTTFYAIVPEWKMSPMNFKNNLLSFSEQGQKTIGCEFFKNYVTTIDFKKHTIYLNKLKEPQESSIKSFGFSPVLENQKLIAGKVINSSQAFKQGLLPGSQIISIDATSYENTTSDMYCHFLNFFKLNQAAIKIVFLSNGIKKEIILAKEEILK
jgi:hypothetical protein